MKTFSDRSTAGLLLACQIYGAVEHDLNEARKNLKISSAVFGVSLLLISTGILGFFPGSDLMRSDIISGIAYLSFLGGLVITIWNFNEFRLKNNIETLHRDNNYSDYRISMIKDDKVWFDVEGSVKSVKREQINDDFVKYLLSNNVKDVN